MVSNRLEAESGWRRSQLHGVRADDALTTTTLDVRARAAALDHAVATTLADVARDFAGLDLFLFAADRSGRLIRLVGPWKSALGEQIRRRGLDVGVCLAEEAAGFNGIGAALELGRGVAVDGEEHYLDAFRAFSCFGVPLAHPGVGRVHGALSVVTFAGATPTLVEGLARHLGRQIEQALGAATYADELRLLTEFRRLTRGRGSAVVGVGEESILLNAAAERLVRCLDGSELRALAVRARRGELDGGDVGVAGGFSVADVSEASGMTLMRLERAATETTPRPTPGAGRGTWAPAVEAAREARGSVSVIGEPGSGRTAAARRIAGPDAVILEVGRAQTPEDTTWLRGLEALVRRPGPPVVVDDVDALEPRLLPGLRRALRQGRCRIVMTAQVQPTTDVSAVLALTEHRVQLSPLRRRLAEFPALLAAMAAQVHGASAPMFSPEAVRVLAQQHWPGNLVELEYVVGRVGRRAGGGRVTVAELPASHRGEGTVPLLGLERAEREAIIDALESAGGNKVRAAAALGVSRATLYRRLRTLRITQEG
ncbi:Sigma 54 specific transcriptional regulator, fisfamily [Micrococcus luteus]|nr:Sigma 54 specific transcriptional regulator, fisfamily [Micrococcus luteus]